MANNIQEGRVQSFPDIFLMVRENPAKNLSQKTDPTEDRTSTRWVRGNDVIPWSWRWSDIGFFNQLTDISSFEEFLKSKLTTARPSELSLRPWWSTSENHASHHHCFSPRTLGLKLELWNVYTVSAILGSEHTYSYHSWECLPQPGTKRRGKGILRMEDAGTSEEDDSDSQDWFQYIYSSRPSSPELFNKNHIRNV